MGIRMGMRTSFFSIPASFHGVLRRACFILCALACEAMPLAAAAAADSAVIIMYHHFGEKKFPSSNIRIDQFEVHIAELKTGGYHVLPVPEILSALREKRALPERTVGITMDDGYRSIFTEAFPRLKEAGFPFTVFVATDGVDQKYRNLMTWDQIRELAAHGVTIGAHTASHLHMAEASRSRNLENIARSNARFREELGFTPKLFAYPFGESGLAVRDVTIAAGYQAAFGQHSGVLHPADDFFNLPRFSLNERYGGIKRFRRVTNALPLPISERLPADTVLRTDRPAVGFTIAEGIDNIGQIACFPSGKAKAIIERLGERRIEVRFTASLPVGRTRLNCTLPGPQGRWRWLGLIFLRLEN